MLACAPVRTVETVMAFDDAEVRRLLSGSEAEIRSALALIQLHLEARVSRWLCHNFPALSPEDLRNAWSDTLARVLEAALEHEFDPQRCLRSWLYRIAWARAADLNRTAARQDRLLRALAGALPQPGASLHECFSTPTE